MLRTITFLLGTTVAQASGPLDDIRGPVNQAIECMAKHGRPLIGRDQRCLEQIKAVAWLCGTKGRNSTDCLIAFNKEIDKHFPVPKQKSVLSPEASAVLDRMLADDLRENYARMDRWVEESQRRDERQAEEQVRSWERANDEYRMWEMNDRLERLERR